MDEYDSNTDIPWKEELPPELLVHVGTKSYIDVGHTVNKQEHLISPLVFIEVHVVLSFVSPYFML